MTTTWVVDEELSLPFLSQHQSRRSMTDEEFNSYLIPHLNSLHDPFLLKGMKEAVDRTLKAVHDKEKVMLISDYDIDGISSCSIVMKLLPDAGLNLEYEIPNRKDGYGLSIKLVDYAHFRGATLIITADNGIASIDAVKHANSLGIDVIVTDHHEPGPVLPDCIIVNPHQPDCPYPFKGIAGCAVAWKFCQAVLRSLHIEEQAFTVYDMLALGTVADVMDLVDENRFFVKEGIQSIANGDTPGIYQLMEAMEITRYPVDAGTIGFSLGPALNAAGRLDDAKEGVNLIMNPSRIQRYRSAQFIAQLNAERKEWTKEYTELFLESIGETDDGIIIAYYPGVPEGIVGIIASRIKEHYNRPVMLFTDDSTGTLYKGSGRSIEAYNMFENLTLHKSSFVAMGGHSMACGFSVKPNHFDSLKSALLESCPLVESDFKRVVYADYEVEGHQLSLSLAEDIKKLAPFGNGNPSPLFYIPNVMVLEAKFIGATSTTLKLKILSDGKEYSCIAFGKADEYQEMVAQVPTGQDTFLDMLFELEVNEWRGNKSLQLKITNMRISYT